MNYVRPERNAVFRNCGGNHFDRDCSEPTTRNANQQGELMLHSEIITIKIMLIELFSP